MRAHTAPPSAIAPRVFREPSGGRSPEPATPKSSHSAFLPLWVRMDERISAGIRSVFQENMVAADRHIEFMDARRHGTSLDLERLHDYYKHKFRGLEFDVIIASDNAALEFLLQNHQELFPQTPVVFCGVGTIERYDFSKESLFTGIVEITDRNETVALALQLHPEAQRVVVVTDHQPTLKAAQSGSSDLQQTFSHVQFVFLDPTNLELSELLDRLRNIPRDTVGLMEAFFVNKPGPDVHRVGVGPPDFRELPFSRVRRQRQHVSPWHCRWTAQ